MKQIPGQSSFPAPQKGNGAARKGTNASALKHPSCSLLPKPLPVAQQKPWREGTESFILPRAGAGQIWVPSLIGLYNSGNIGLEVMENTVPCQREQSISWTQTPVPQRGVEEAPSLQSVPTPALGEGKGCVCCPALCCACFQEPSSLESPGKVRAELLTFPLLGPPTAWTMR